MIAGELFEAHFGIHESRNETEPGRVIVFIKKNHVFVHPSNKGIMNDIALMKMCKPIKFTSFIEPIKLSRSLGVDENLDVFAVGNGYVGKGVVAKYLEWVPLKTMSHDQCKRIFPMIETIIYAGNTYGSISFGDSGGPLVFNNTLIGISSFIHNETSLVDDGRKILPQAFTHIARFIEWIRLITKLDFK